MRVGGVAVGIGAGIAGISIILVLNLTAYLAFGHTPGSGTLLESIESTPPWRRFVALFSAGVVGAVGWYLLRRSQPEIVSDEDAILLKIIATLTTMGAGAAGGTMTPALAFGASLGALFGGMWSFFLPGTPIAAFAVVGAAAFLASAIQAPLSALVLTIEFTGQSFDFYVPMMFAVAGSVFIGQMIERRRITGAY